MLAICREAWYIVSISKASGAYAHANKQGGLRIAKHAKEYGMKMSEMKTKDPAQYKAIKEKKGAKRAAKNEALKTILAFANEKGDEKIKALCAQFTARAASGPRAASTPSFLAVLNDLFKSANTVIEDVPFKLFKMGRGEMRHVCLKAIKNAKPADRIWVHFDPNTGVYTLKGRGEKAPAGWTGYKPLVIDGAEVK